MVDLLIPIFHFTLIKLLIEMPILKREAILLPFFQLTQTKVKNTN